MWWIRNDREFAPDEQSLLLEVKGLTKFFPIRSKGLRRKVIGQVQAVDDVSFKIFEGETLGLVGESGCGKTTTARCIMRALGTRRVAKFCSASLIKKLWILLLLVTEQMFPLRRDIQMIFQDPYCLAEPAHEYSGYHR